MRTPPSVLVQHKDQLYSLTHRHLFLIGWAYYLLTPLTLGHLGMFARDDLNYLDKYFDPKSPWWGSLIWFTALCAFAYWVGSNWRAVPTPRRLPQESIRPKAGAWSLVLVYAGLLVVFSIQARAQLFAGYTDSMDLSLAGPISTLEMLILYQYLYEKSRHRTTSSYFGLLLILTSLILLGMGGRLYVLSAGVAVYFQWWNWRAESRRSQVQSILLLIFAVMAMLLLGMWRVGSTDYSTIGFFLVAESIFTSISSFSLFTGGTWQPWDYPKDFLSAFINIIPSTIWPDKGNLLIQLIDTKIAFDSPFGALNIITSTIGNFGYIGGLLFFLFVGAYMTTWSRFRNAPACEAHYCYLVGLLPFMFFRDPFQVQVKVVITGLILYWLTRLINK